MMTIHSGDLRLVAFAALFALAPIDTVVTTPQRYVLVVGDDGDAAAPDSEPPADMNPEQREAAEAASRAYLQAREARKKAEGTPTDPDNED